MERNLIFHILGIGITKDENAIRDAYRSALKNNNPEDNPEGFKELRTAYEEALAYARTPDEEPNFFSNTASPEVAVWLQKVNNLYTDLPSRWDISKWESLLEEDLCQSIDTAVEVKEQFVLFLMDHFYLPYAIWKYFDKIFYLLDSMEELREKFPPDFLNYMTFNIKHESFLPYKLFSYRNPKDKSCEGDTYISLYFAIKQKIDAEDTKECYALLDELTCLGVYHPYEDVERTRLLLMAGKKTEALSLISPLCDKYPKNPYIRLYTGLAKWENQDKEAAVSLWKDILAEYPLYYRASYFLSQYYIEEGLYYDAKDIIIQLLEADSEEKGALDSMKKVNDILIEILTRDMETGRPNERYSPAELPIELGWCLFQSQRLEEAVSVLQNYVPTEKTSYGYYNLYGRVLYHMKRYSEALPFVKKWYDIIFSLKEDGTEETKKRMSRFDMATYILSDCYSELNQIEDAEKIISAAISRKRTPLETSEHKNHLAEIYMKHERYEQSIDLCDKIIDEDVGYYPAYVTRMECFFHLDKDQEVVDDYHCAIAIYPDYYKPYMFASEVFFQHSQFEDAREVLEVARKNKVTFTPRMRLCEAKILHGLARNAEDTIKIIPLMEDLQKERTNPDCDIEDLAEIDYEIGLLYWDISNLSKAYHYIQSAHEENPDFLQYQMTLGDILSQMKLFQEALEVYQKGKIHYEHVPIYHYKLAICYDGLGQNEKAIDCYTNTLKLDDTYRDCNEKLADVYNRLYHKKENPKWLNLAILHARKQIAIADCCYYHVNLGLIFMNAMIIEPAIEEFKIALKFDPEDWAAWNNLGCCYKYLGEFKQAIACLEKAAQYMKEDKSQKPYGNMADCYEAMCEYEKAISCYKMNLTYFPDDLSIWEAIGDLYSYMDNEKEAIAAYKHTDNLELITKKSIYFSVKNEKKLSSLLTLQSYIRNAEESKIPERYHFLGDLFFDEMANYKKASNYFQEAQKYPLDLETRFKYEKDCALTLYMLKQFEAAKEHAELAIKAFMACPYYETEELYCDYTPYTPIRLGIMGSIYMTLGNTEKALRLFARMKTSLRCKGCRYSSCYEYHLLQGHYYNVKGDVANALLHYNKALEINPHCGIAKIEQKKLEK